MKQLWDDLDELMPDSDLLCRCGLCICDRTKIIAEAENKEKLIQFQVGLNDSFTNSQNQILVLQPLPSVNKAYSMILRVEKQQQLQASLPGTLGTTAMYSDSKQSNKSGPGRNGSATGGKGQGFKPKRTKEVKVKLLCDHCHFPGHEIGECFRLHGFPDWYKKLKEQKGKMNVDMAATPFSTEVDFPESTKGRENMSTIIQAELVKFFNKSNQDKGNVSTHFSGYAGGK